MGYSKAVYKVFDLVKEKNRNLNLKTMYAIIRMHGWKIENHQVEKRLLRFSENKKKLRLMYVWCDKTLYIAKVLCFIVNFYITAAQRHFFYNHFFLFSVLAIPRSFQNS